MTPANPRHPIEAVGVGHHNGSTSGSAIQGLDAQDGIALQARITAPVATGG